VIIDVGNEPTDVDTRMATRPEARP
jgi:hypothetical protein